MRFRSLASLLLVLLVLLAAGPANAQPAPDAELERGPGAIVGCVVPGLIVHGAGHLFMGETETGMRLMLAEGIGLGAAVGSVAGVALTGASPKLVAPLAATAV